jgi:hypothetical protein
MKIKEIKIIENPEISIGKINKKRSLSFAVKLKNRRDHIYIQLEKNMHGETVFYNAEWGAHSTSLKAVLKEVLDIEESYIQHLQREEAEMNELPF